MHASSVNAFERRRDKLCENLEIKYKFKDLCFSVTPGGCQLEFEDCDVDRSN